jgi:4-amino-4-deoxy-L-arabinose transferase-like glycosyltransferase
MNRTAVIITIGVLLLGAFLRLYRIEETLQFQADQGRDAMVAHNILKGDLVLLGPVTSVGNMYLGPFYYYFMTPFLALTYPNPVGPAIGVALLNIALIGLVIVWGRHLFGLKTALIGGFMLAIHLIAIDLSRFSWNPNIALFFAFLSYAFSVKAIQSKKYAWFVPAWLAFGLLTQSHYLALLMVGVPIAAILYAFIADKVNRWAIIKYALVGMVVYAATWLPIVAFDWRNNGLIQEGFATYLGDQVDKQPLAHKILDSVKGIEGRSFRILAQLQQSPDGVVDRIIVWSMLGLSGLLIWFKQLKPVKDPALFLLVVWILTGVIGTTIYPDTIHDHYLAYLIPGVLLYFAWLLRIVGERHWMGKVIGLLILVIYSYVNLQHTPAFSPPGPSARVYESFVSQIKPKIDGEKYNIALLSDNKDWRGLNYRYFLTVSPNPPAHVEDYDDLDLLVIIDELRVEDPFLYEIYEIQVPGLRHIREIIEIANGPRVYLVGNEELE